MEIPPRAGGWGQTLAERILLTGAVHIDVGTHPSDGRGTAGTSQAFWARGRGGGAMSSGGAVVSGGRVVIASGGAVISVSGGLARQPAVQGSRPHSRRAQPKSRPYRGLICFMSDPF